MSLENFTIQPSGSDKTERKVGYGKAGEVHCKHKAFLTRS